MASRLGFNANVSSSIAVILFLSSLILHKFFPSTSMIDITSEGFSIPRAVPIKPLSFPLLGISVISFWDRSLKCQNMRQFTYITEEIRSYKITEFILVLE